jgi:hypothetical protein
MMTPADHWPNAGRIVRWPDEASWRTARLDGLGASDVPKVLGLSPYGGPWSVWAPRLLGDVPREMSGPMLRGIHLEAGVLSWWAAETGAEVLGPLGPLHVHGAHPLIVTPDAACRWERFPGNGGAEVKTDDSRYRWGRSGRVVTRWTADEALDIREDYAAQAYACMDATGADWWALVVLCGLSDLRWYVLMRDDDIQGRIRTACRSWWVRHIEGATPPPTDDTEACARALARLQPKYGEKREATTDEAVMAAELDAWRKQRKALDSGIRAASAALASSIGETGHDSVTWDSGAKRPHRATRVHRGESVHVRTTIQEA